MQSIAGRRPRHLISIYVDWTIFKINTIFRNTLYHSQNRAARKSMPRGWRRRREGGKARRRAQVSDRRTQASRCSRLPSDAQCASRHRPRWISPADSTMRSTPWTSGRPQRFDLGGRQGDWSVADNCMPISLQSLFSKFGPSCKWKVNYSNKLINFITCRDDMS